MKSMPSFFIPIVVKMATYRSQVKVGQQKEFEVALKRLRGSSAEISQEAAEIKVLSQSHISIRKLFSFLTFFYYIGPIVSST